jgi:hypothetical protein
MVIFPTCQLRLRRRARRSAAVRPRQPRRYTRKPAGRRSCKSRPGIRPRSERIRSKKFLSQLTNLGYRIRMSSQMSSWRQPHWLTLSLGGRRVKARALVQVFLGMRSAINADGSIKRRLVIDLSRWVNKLIRPDKFRMVQAAGRSGAIISRGLSKYI